MFCLENRVLVCVSVWGNAVNRRKATLFIIFNVLRTLTVTVLLMVMITVLMKLVLLLTTVALGQILTVMVS